MHAFLSSWRRVSIVAIFAAAPAAAYEQGANTLAHQWITQQAVLFYRSQFGASEVDSFLGAVQTYTGGANNRFIEGTFDEDVDNENPFNQANPFFNHFWAYSTTDFSRVFDRGLTTLGPNDAAPNRAIKLFTGGNGLTGMYDTLYARAQGAQRDRGIVWHWRNDTGDNARKGRAYYWLGEAAHLLQDATLPCHVLDDPHPVTVDQDPTHDWVDGRAFSSTFFGGAAFDDNTARRWERWAFQAGPRAVGRPAGASALESGDIRSTEQLRTMTLAAEWTASVPNGAQAQSLPLYHLFLETAGRADNYDSRDRNGQRDAGARRGNAGGYNQWTMAELDSVADIIVPRAMKASAELLRYFYSLVDDSPPDVPFQNLLPIEEKPVIVHGDAITPRAAGTDSTSGVDLDGYRFALDRFLPCCGWTEIDTRGPGAPEIAYQGLEIGRYRVRVSVENGAGLTGQGVGYFDIEAPVAVQAEDFEASATADGVRLTWRFPSPREVAAVRVLRAEQSAGPYASVTLASFPVEATMTFVDAGVEPDREYWYRLELESQQGQIVRSHPLGIRTGLPDDSIVLETALGSRAIEIRFALGTARRAMRLDVFDVRGRFVRTLASGPHAAGRYVRTWDRTDGAGRTVPHGVYLVQLTADADQMTRKLVLTAP